MTPLARFELDPEQEEGPCRSGGHTVTGRDHARPMLLPDGGTVHVCIFCWQAADIALLRAQGTPIGLINRRRQQHEQQRNRLIIDEVAVARVAAGGVTYRILTPREKQAAVRLMTARGMSADQIGAFTGMHEREVERKRSTPVGASMRAWERRLLQHLTGQTIEHRELVAA